VATETRRIYNVHNMATTPRLQTCAQHNGEPVAVVCWGQGGTGPQILSSPPPILIGSIVISLSRCCLPNDEGPRPRNIFLRTATAGNIGE